MSKVCMIVHQDYESDARVKRYAEALVEAGVQVDVLGVREQTQSLARSRTGLRVFTIPIGRGYKQRASYLVEYSVALCLFGIWLLALYLKNRYRAIHVHNMPDFLVFATLIPKLCGAKVILDIHDPMPEFYMSKYSAPKESLAVRLMRAQERLSASFADAIIAANDNFKRRLVERGAPAEKITVVNNVADPKLFNRNEYQTERRNKDGRFTLIYPGTIAPRYGLEIAICALPLLMDRIPQIRLVIMGPPVAYGDELARLAQQLNVTRLVEFSPAVPLHEVPRYMARADVGIYPALPDAHMSIATPSKVLEYVSMGLPVIAARLPVLVEQFSAEELMFFEPGNVEQFAACVLELYENPAKRAALTLNTAQGFVRTHSWQHERARYFHLLRRLLPAEPEAALLAEIEQRSVRERVS